MYNTMLSAEHLRPQTMGADFFESIGAFLEQTAQATGAKLEEMAPQVLAQQIIAANVPGYKNPVPVARTQQPITQPTQSLPTTVTLQPNMAVPPGYVQIPMTQTAVKSTTLLIVGGLAVAAIVAIVIASRK